MKGRCYFDDEFEYQRVVENFLSGKGLMTSEIWKAYRPPLYPLFLSFLRLLKLDLSGIRMAQVLLSSLTVILIYFLARKVFSEKVAWFSALLSCFYPFFIFYSGFLLTETLFVFLVVWSVYELVKLRTDARWFCPARAGIALGLAGLCRPTMELFVPLALVLVLAGREPFPIKFRKAFLTGLFFVLTLSPWIVRNYRILHEFVPGTTMGGWVFWEGNNPQSDGGPCRYFPEGIARIPETERDAYLYRLTWLEIRKNPGRFRWLLRNKFFRFWNVVPNAAEFTRPRYRIISVFSFGILLPFFILGFLVGLGNNRAVFFHALIILFTVFHMIYLASIRYRVAIEPFYIILAVQGLSLFFDIVKKGTVSFWKRGQSQGP